MLLLRNILISAIIGLLVTVPPTATAAPSAITAQPHQKTSAKKSTNKKKSTKGKQTSKKAPKESSATVKKQEQSVQKEIKLTKQQIEDNEAAVRENLILLTNLEHDINLQNQKVVALQKRHTQISSDIAGCKAQIRSAEAGLSALRARYVAVIKKMRIARKRANPLAYIFASKSFYQAWRRMRYLMKFNDWRSHREQEIKSEVARLARLSGQLATGQQQLQANLTEQQQARNLLASKHKAQDEAVKKLRSHGDALRAHLAHKQAEANALSAKVMELIAREQAEAAQREQQRRAAAEKAAREQAAREKAAAEKAAAEKAAKEKAEREQAEQQNKQQNKQKDKQKDKKREKPQAKKEPAKASRDKSYAEARGRKPRSGSQTAKPAKEASPATNTVPSTAASGFAAAKGSLPRPVSGQFSIVSRFGRHPLPDLPEVMFDNPGIDAVVAPGASALAVYPGTVTGVYVLPGFETVVIVSHGEYYTVYGNIGKPAVSKGDKVQQGQPLGKLVSDADEGGRTTIHFEIYKNREKLNPEAWIR